MPPRQLRPNRVSLGTYAESDDSDDDSDAVVYLSDDDDENATIPAEDHASVDNNGLMDIPSGIPYPPEEDSVMSTGSGTRRSSEAIYDEAEDVSASKKICPDENDKKVDLNLSTMSQNEGTQCTVCFENWTNSGSHRLVCIKCGHCFGQSCIERWIIQSKSKARCPICNVSCKRGDIRPIFIRNLTAIDTLERENLTLEVRKEKDARISLEKELVQVKHKLASSEVEIERLKHEILTRQEVINSFRTGSRSISHLQNVHDQRSDQPRIKSLNSSTAKFVKIKEQILSKEGNCRVMASSKILDFVAVSVPNGATNEAFKSYGIRRVTTHNFGVSDFIPIHKKRIKDLCFKPEDPLLLSTSQDKTLKLTSCTDKANIATMQLDADGWSCCWHPTRTNSCFVGNSKGIIQEFDIRNPKNQVHTFDFTAESPLVSIQFVQGQGSETMNPTGIFGNTLKQCFFVPIDEATGKQETALPLPYQGNFLPVHYDFKCGYGLISTRANKTGKANEYVVIDFAPASPSNESPIVCSFSGGNSSEILSRPKIFNNPDAITRNAFVFAYDEDSSSIACYDTETQVIDHKIKLQKPAVDIDLVPSDSSNMKIIALTDTSLTLFERK